jgi:hypothetical protein
VLHVEPVGTPGPRALLLLQPDFFFGMSASWSSVDARPRPVLIGAGKVLLSSIIGAARRTRPNVLLRTVPVHACDT